MKKITASLILTAACFAATSAFADGAAIQATPPSAMNAMAAQPADTDDDNMCELEDCSDRALLADAGTPMVAPAASALPQPATPVVLTPVATNGY